MSIILSLNHANFKSLTVGKRQYLLLLAIFIVGFLIRLLLLDKRWINPDEGAHIMDGRLVLDGLVPEVDYGSRQIVYVYIIALILEVFGISYTSVRFLPLISTMGISLLVFFISKKLFDEKVGLLACVIYTFLPLSVVESTIVKTEPLTTLLSCIGIYLVISGVEGERRATLLFFLSGVVLSLAYYVRESSLAIPVAIFLFLVIAYWKKFQKLFINYAIILSGYLFICLIVFAYFGQFMTVSQVWNSSINPLDIVLRSFQNIFSSFMPQAEVLSDSLEPSGFESWSLTVSYLSLTLLTHSFLLVGFLFSVFISAYSLLIKIGDENSKKVLLSFSLLYSWLFSLVIFYLYWTLHRVFFIQYFEEFLPPLTIILAFVINCSLSKLESQRNLRRNVAIVVLLLFIVFFSHRMASDFQIKSVIYFPITTLCLAFFYFSSRLRLERWLYVLMAAGVISVSLIKLASLSPYFIKPLLYLILIVLVYLIIFAVSDLKLKRDFKSGLCFIAFSLFISSCVLSFGVSGHNMGVSFDGVWSPEAVRETSDYIKVNSNEDDEVMSGAVIWELESNLRPFMNQTHPLSYEVGISERELKNIEWYLSNYPPRFIVLDGYTERTYLRYVDKLQIIMDEKYQLRKVIDGSRYPVKIYELKDG